MSVVRVKAPLNPQAVYLDTLGIGRGNYGVYGEVALVVFRGVEGGIRRDCQELRTLVQVASVGKRRV